MDNRCARARERGRDDVGVGRREADSGAGASESTNHVKLFCSTYIVIEAVKQAKKELRKSLGWRYIRLEDMLRELTAPGDTFPSRKLLHLDSCDTQPNCIL